jgi:hypothetical protein
MGVVLIAAGERAGPEGGGHLSMHDDDSEADESAGTNPGAAGVATLTSSTNDVVSSWRPTTAKQPVGSLKNLRAIVAVL